MARVLVIDDDELFVKLICHSLKQKGHVVESQLDGFLGWKAFCNSEFDVVVCDMVMPEQEGIETIRRIRHRRPDVGVVAISGGLTTANGTPIDLLGLVEVLGADVTLKKPFQLSELAAAVEGVLQLRNPTRLTAQR